MTEEIKEVKKMCRLAKLSMSCFIVILFLIFVIILVIPQEDSLSGAIASVLIMMVPALVILSLILAPN